VNVQVEFPDELVAACVEHYQRPTREHPMFAQDRRNGCSFPTDNLVIAKFLSTLKVDHDRPALGGREQHARHLPAGPRHARRIGSRLTCSPLFR